MLKRAKKFRNIMYIWHPFEPKARKIVLITIIIATTSVILSLFATFYFSPDKLARREVAKLAQSYYENYFYDLAIQGKSTSAQDQMFRTVAKDGFSPILLRNFLAFDKSRGGTSASKFNTPTYFCDPDESYIIFKPKAPFGKRDYLVIHNLQCISR